MWIKITGGTGSGQIRRIVNVIDAHTLTVVSAWATVPDTSSTYTIFQAEVTLYDSGGTNYVTASVDMNLLPATAQTDTGIAIAFNGLTANPQYVDNTRTVLTWNVAQGGTADDTDFINRVAATPSLIGSSLLPYLQGGWQPQNTALKGAGLGGVDIGAVPFSTPPAVTKHLVGIEGGRLIIF
jgi:hypothetical protein